MGCDLVKGSKIAPLFMFQFTHPVWGATQQSQVEGLIFPVSIHAPRVGCDRIGSLLGSELRVSIHAPRVGCDSKYTALGNNIKEFQFTHPVWGATMSGRSR